MNHFAPKHLVAGFPENAAQADAAASNDKVYAESSMQWDCSAGYTRILNEKASLQATSIMKIVSAAEMREIDRATSERFGVPSITLMENAGSAVARFVLSDYPQAERVGVVCGKGNNGGDGFVVARKLVEAGRAVRVLLLCDPEELRGDAAAMFQKMLGDSPAVECCAPDCARGEWARFIRRRQRSSRRT